MMFHGVMDTDARAETIALVDFPPAELAALRATAEQNEDVGALVAILRAEELQDIEAEEHRVYDRDPVDDDGADEQADRYEKEIYK